MVRVLFIVPYTQGSGNRTTADRIKRFIEPHVQNVTVVDALCPPQSLSDSFDVAILLHAYKSGKIYLQLNLNIPYGVIFGGTDLNSDVTDYEKKALVDAITLGAEVRVCFTDNFYKLASEMWPLLEFETQPQSVDLQPAPCADNISNKVIMISGIRPVKDVLFAITCWNHFTSKYPEDKTELLIIGPIIDHEYAQKVFEELDNASNIRYIACMKQEKLFELLRTSLATVNSSISEGQSAAVLESMSFGIPVIARDIPGNDYIEHDKTSFLYKTPQEFTKMLKLLVDDKSKWMEMSSNAQQYIKIRHSAETEELFYTTIVKKL